MTILKLAITAFSITGAITLAPLLHAQVTTTNVATRQASQQDHEAHHPGADTAQPPKPVETQAGGMHGQMLADMKEQDAKIDALVAKMNAAKGNAKVDAIAELLTAMVQQRRSMEARMMQMHEQMMNRMHSK
jgi:hypothetical protein